MSEETRASSATDYDSLKDLWERVRKLRTAVESNRIAYYRPHHKQVEFHAADTFEVRLVYGGNQSGKTTCGAIEAIAHALGYRPWLPEGHPNRVVRLANGDPIPVPNIGRIVVENYETNVIQTLEAKMKEWAPAGEIASIRRNPRGVPLEYRWKNGSTQHVMTYEQDDDTFEGTQGHYAWCDEPPPQRKFNGLRRGLMYHSGHVWLTLTPLSEPWINTVLARNANVKGSHVKMLTFDIWDNCTTNGGVLTPRAIRNFLEDLPTAERQAREHGTPLHLAGRVFPEWKAEAPFWVPAFDPPAHWPRVELCDPHPRKPMAVMWAAVSPDNVWYIYRCMYREDLRTVYDVAAAVYEAEGWEYVGEKFDWVLHDKVPVYRPTADAENVVLRIIDTSANEQERTSGSTIAEQFAGFGLYHVDAYKRNRDAGLNAIHTALRLKTEWAKPGLVVTDNCPEIKQNFENYIWDRWGSSKQSALKGEKQDVVKWDDDFIDLIRYLFQMRLSYDMLRSGAFRPEKERDDWDRGDALQHFRRNSGRRSPSAALRTR